MLLPGEWIRDGSWRQSVCLQVECITDKKFERFQANKTANLLILFRYGEWVGENQGLGMCYTGDQTEWSRGNVHFPITDQNIAIASKTMNAPVFMDIFVICI